MMILAFMCIDQSIEAYAGDSLQNRWTWNAQEKRELAELAAQTDGAMVYSSSGQIRMVRFGEWQPIHLGRGDYARFGPDGRLVAVYDAGRIYLVDVSNKSRKRLYEGADVGAGCPIEFHTNNRQIIFWIDGVGFHTVHIETGQVKNMNLPAPYNGAPCISADGKRMAVRWDGDLYAIDITNKTHRKYARGCSPGVSPDGRFLINNVGSHREIIVREWEGSEAFRIHAESCRPDRKWDNHHYSNNANYISAQGEGRGGYAYVFNIYKNKGYRVTQDGEVRYPDVYIKNPKMQRWDFSEGKWTPVVETAEKSTEKSGPYKSWPGSQNGLVFLWENAAAPNEVYGHGGQLVRTCRVKPFHAARYGRFHAMELGGGYFRAENIGGGLLKAAKASNEIAIEGLFTADQSRVLDRQPLINYSEEDTSRGNFTIYQEGNQLMLRLKTASTGDDEGNPAVAIGPVKAHKPSHLLVSYKPGRLVVFINGNKLVDTDALKGGFQQWEHGTLVFGSGYGGRGSWSGKLEGIAIYRRAIGQKEARGKYALYRKKLLGRTPAKGGVVIGRLTAISPIPGIDDIAPYRRALVVYEYEVEAIKEGNFEEDNILVAHWGILDSRIVRKVQQKKAGALYTLELEAFEDHDELKSEYISNEIEKFDLDLFLDVGRIGQTDLVGHRRAPGARWHPSRRPIHFLKDSRSIF